MEKHRDPKYFQQEEPRLGNQYLEDSFLLSVLHRRVPPSILQQVEPDLIRFGDRVSPSGDIWKYAKLCEDNPPRLSNYNAWGRRVDEIIVHPGWDRLHDISAEEGLVSIGYEQKYAEWSRLIQYIKIYLFSASSATYTCPLAMTDGAARLISIYGNKVRNPEHRKQLRVAFERLTTRDPALFWTSGQWMTEKTGGSDVQLSETVAHYDPIKKTYILSGLKFFTSSTTSEVAFTLARIKPGQPLSAFYLETRKPGNSRKTENPENFNGIKIHKLKEKLGTRAVPTAELELEGTEAILVGEEGGGVKVMSEILNVTRVFNASCSVATCRRSIALARDFASRRHTFGNLLMENALHVATLADMEIEYRAGLLFFVDVLIKFGKTEYFLKEDRSETLPKKESPSELFPKKGSPELFPKKESPSELFPKKDSGYTDLEKESLLLRILIPLLKLYTARQAVRTASEGIEALGGSGYMEDSHVPVLLRTAQVTTIWEGTTNVLAHDLWRPLQKKNALPVFIEAVLKLIQNKGKSYKNLENLGNTPKNLEKLVNTPKNLIYPPKTPENPQDNFQKRIESLQTQIQTALDSIVTFTQRVGVGEGGLNSKRLAPYARDFAFSMSRVYIAALMVDHAVDTGLEADVGTAWRFCEGGIYRVVGEEEMDQKESLDRLLGLDVEEGTGRVRGMGDIDPRGVLRARY